MFGLFRRRVPQERAQANAVRAMVRRRLSLADDVSITVSEIQCGDIACPGVETVVLVMAPGSRTKAYRIRRPLAAADEAAVHEAMIEGGAPC
jgi:hypothetical protein